MGPQGNTFGLQHTTPPIVGTGLRGSNSNASERECRAGRSTSAPSPVSVFALPLLAKKRDVILVRASGHSCSSRHRFAPMTKIRTGGRDISGVSFAFNH